MKSNKIKTEDKAAELAKYRDLVTATLNHLVDNNAVAIKTSDFDSIEHFRSLKLQAIEHFQKGRLSRLKQWFRDLTEMYRETGDLKFQSYLKDVTGYDVNIFQDYYDRVDKIIMTGKIMTDNQFRDINSMVDHLSQMELVDDNKVALLNSLLLDYGQRKTRRKST